MQVVQSNLNTDGERLQPWTVTACAKTEGPKAKAVHIRPSIHCTVANVLSADLPHVPFT